MTSCSLDDRNQQCRSTCWLLLRYVILPSRRQHVPSRCWVLTPKLHGVISQKIIQLSPWEFQFSMTACLPSIIPPDCSKLQHRSQCHIVAMVSTTVRTPRHEMLIIPGSLTWPKNCCVWSSNVSACAVKAMTTATLRYVLSLRKQSLMLLAAGGYEGRFLIVKHCSNKTFSNSSTG
jgi:hypothetical protein